MSTEAQDMVETIERLQAAVGEDDRAGIKEFLCQDFHAFENGVHMTGRELLEAMSRWYAQGKQYRWSVNSPQIEVQGDLDAVVYVNHGSVADAPGVEPNPVSWLETVLLRREESAWRVAFLHSTRTNPSQSAV